MIIESIFKGEHHLDDSCDRGNVASLTQDHAEQHLYSHLKVRSIKSQILLRLRRWLNDDRDRYIFWCTCVSLTAEWIGNSVVPHTKNVT